jgi:DNA-binding CsgD family transcriptional regulator
MSIAWSKSVELGRRAFANRAWADAFRLLSNADSQTPLEMADLQKMGLSATMIGNDEAAFAVLNRGYDILLSMGNKLGAARLAFWHGFRCFSLGETGRATAWMGRAESLVAQHGDDCPERGYLLLPTVHQLLQGGNAKSGFELATDAAATGDRFHDDDLSGLARQLQGRALLMLGEGVRGLRLLDDAMLIATTGAVSEVVRGVIYCSVIGCCQQVYAVDRAREWTAVLNEWCEAQPQLGIFNGACRVHRAELMQINGTWARAIEEARQVSAREPPHAASERAAAVYQEAEIYRLRGEFAAAEQGYARANELGGDIQPGLALLRLAQGQVDAAAASIKRVADTLKDTQSSVRLLPAYVEIMLAANNITEARTATLRLQEAARFYSIPVVSAIADHAQGALELWASNAKDALPPLQRAFAVWHKLGAPYLAARIRVLLGQACHLLGDNDGCHLELIAARKVFVSLEARADIARIDALGMLPALTPSVGGLSAREIEVLRLAAAGKTNKVIAAELGLSYKTIDRHISNILTKLDVPSRAAATAYAYEHRLINA